MCEIGVRTWCPLLHQGARGGQMLVSLRASAFRVPNGKQGQAIGLGLPGLGLPGKDP